MVMSLFCVELREAGQLLLLFQLILTVANSADEFVILSVLLRV
jgi:hypothetical protein